MKKEIVLPCIIFLIIFMYGCAPAPPSTLPFRQQTEDPFIDAGDELKACLIGEIGQEAFQAVATKQRLATPQEIDALKRCIDIVNSKLQQPPAQQVLPSNRSTQESTSKQPVEASPGPDHSSSETSPTQNFRQSPEIPTDLERATLPDCTGKQFSVFPVDLSQVFEIAPLGSVNPPGHTFPTEHTYLHFQAGGTSTKMYPLSAPAEVYIISISKGTGFTQDPEDYTIYFALCKDVIGYYNHVKELSPELQNIFTIADAAGKCKQNPGNTQYTYCENALNLVKAGNLIGKVGRLQGNFDFGLIDLRKTLNYVNPSRYGKRSLHIQCPYEYYPAAMKEQFFEKIVRNDQGQCGTVAQDVAGTLQGNWFYAGARADAGADWTKYLAFVTDNFNPEQQVISIGGVFTDTGKWYFTPQSSGQINWRFSEVTADGRMYCYESSPQQGRILVQLTSDTTLKIEKQSGSCSPEDYNFREAKIYER